MAVAGNIRQQLLLWGVRPRRLNLGRWGHPAADLQFDANDARSAIATCCRSATQFPSYEECVLGPPQECRLLRCDTSAIDQTAKVPWLQFVTQQVHTGNIWVEFKPLQNPRLQVSLQACCQI